MSKPHRPRRKPPSDFDEYCPGRTDIEKRESRKLASAAYYARNVHLREKNRLKMRERRTAAKAYRRQWDPPKADSPLSNADTGHEDTDTHEEYVPWYGLPRLSGYDADGQSEYSCHYMDFRGLTETSAPHSYWRVRDRIGPPQTESSQRSLAAHSPAADSLGSSANERVAVEALTLMANGTDVRAAATAIQALNSEPLTVPTPEEEREWVGKKRNFRGDYLTWKKFTYIRAWAWGVHLEAAQ